MKVNMLREVIKVRRIVTLLIPAVFFSQLAINMPEWGGVGGFISDIIRVMGLAVAGLMLGLFPLMFIIVPFGKAFRCKRRWFAALSRFIENVVDRALDFPWEWKPRDKSKAGGKAH